ncbi:DUF2490 domain-containing protein [Emticicia sp. 17c]|uniref:DUF2490 domain-containing protein n=1 Tax=Emticicia sp. 17c TaxID=3127704 RepID=UPI00301D64C5
MKPKVLPTEEEKAMIKQLLVALFMYLLVVQAIAQNKSTQDFQTWYDTELKLNLKKGWELKGQYRVRFNENASHYKGSYFFLAGEKKINKYLKVVANYRLALVEDNNYHRFLIGLQGQLKVNDFTFFTRPMIQNQKKYFVGDDENLTDTDTHLRLRTGVKYQISKHWDTYVYAEPFIPIKQGKTPEIRFWQNAAGLSYEYMKNKKATLYYIWQPEVNQKHPHTNHIVGLSLDFEVKPYKKKKKKKNA